MKFKLPKLPHLPRLNIEPVRKIASFFIRHKISITILLSVIVFVTVAMWYRGYLLSKMSSTPGNNSDQTFYSTKSDNPGPTIVMPTPSTDTNNNVLGATNNSNSYRTT